MKLFFNNLFVLIISLSLLFISGCSRTPEQSGEGIAPAPTSENSNIIPNNSENTKEDSTKEQGIKAPSSSQDNSQNTENESPSNNSVAQKNPTTSSGNNKGSNNPPPSSQGQGSSGPKNDTPVEETNTPKDNINEEISTLPSIPYNHDHEFSWEVEEKILSLINAERSNGGVVSLTANSTLRTAARYKANEMLQYDYFSHNSPYSNQPSDIAKALGHSFQTFGENLFSISSSDQSALRENISAEKIVAEWMASEGHRSNILNGNYRKTGIGVVIGSNGKCYISQMFSD